MALLWVLSLTLWILTAAAQNAVPSNTTSYVPPAAADRLILFSECSNIPGMPVNPLIPNNSEAASAGRQGHLIPTGPSTPLYHVNGNIAYISCDPSVYTTGDVSLLTVIDNAIDAHASAVLLYSEFSSYCNLTDAPTVYPWLYTMTNRLNSTNMITLSATVRIISESELNSTKASVNCAQNKISETTPPSPSTAVTMIILYSITGVITVLFFTIIFTGAIRAHRYPERYGPQNIRGRSRQSRAKGIARAMLDTLPIVKFGEQPADEEKTEDLELSRQPCATATAQTTTTAAAATAAAATTHNADEDEDGPFPALPTPAAAATALPTDHNSLLCSICTEDFARGEDIRVLPCNHKYHPACVDPWLLNVSGTCPLCRVDLNPPADADGLHPDAHAYADTDPHAHAHPTLRAVGEDAAATPPDRLEMQQRRRSGLRGLQGLLDRRWMQRASPEERIAVLRRVREEHRRRSSWYR